MKKGIVLLLVVILIGGSIGAYFYFRNRTRSSEVPDILRSAEIIQGDLSQTVSASGNIIYNKSVRLDFRSSGPVDSVKLENGDYVEQGQVLASLDTMELESSYQQTSNALKQAELNLQIALEPIDAAQIELAENAVTSASQALESARLGKLTSQADAANLIVQAQRDREAAYIRLRDASDVEAPNAQNAFNTAVEQEAIAKLNADLLIEQAESQWLSAYLNFKQAERSLEKLQSPPDETTTKQLKLQVNQAQLNLEQAKQNIDDALIIAPFDGTVTQMNLQEGTLPQAAVGAMRLVDKSKIFVEVGIDEIDIGKVQEGMTGTVILDAYPNHPISGVVHKIAPSATDIGGIVSYKVQIQLAIDNDVILREGMTASAEILVNTIENVILIPNWAIRTDQETNETYCYRIINDVPVKTTIVLGVFGISTSSVLEGLEPGEVVALVSEERNLLDPNFQPRGSMRPDF